MPGSEQVAGLEAQKKRGLGHGIKSLLLEVVSLNSYSCDCDHDTRAQKLIGDTGVGWSFPLMQHTGSAAPLKNQSNGIIVMKTIHFYENHLKYSSS